MAPGRSTSTRRTSAPPGPAAADSQCRGPSPVAPLRAQLSGVTASVARKRADRWAVNGTPEQPSILDLTSQEVARLAQPLNGRVRLQERLPLAGWQPKRRRRQVGEAVHIDHQFAAIRQP